MTARFIRVCGEALDADQITPRCADCGLSEYSCECEVEEWPTPRLSEAEAAHRDARIREILEAKALRESGWALAEEAALKRRAA